MGDESKAASLFRQSIEHIEMDFLRLVAEGPGWPVFFVFDLSDPDALELARRVQPAEAIEDAMVGATARGAGASFVYHQVLAEPYHSGDNWWKDCPPGRFPVGIYTDGAFSAIARTVPVGMDQALRRRMLAEKKTLVDELVREYDAGVNSPLVVIIADLSDPKGRQAAEASMGGDEVRRMLATSDGASSVVSVTAGVPISANYPSAWGGPIPPGKVAVQVVAYGGILNEVIDPAEVA
jgi:hypothetical protein